MPSDDLPLLLDVDELQQAMLENDNLLIVDVSSAENFDNGHIPGAVNISPSSLQCGIKPAVGKIPTNAELERLFSSIGLRDDSHIIAYDDEGGGWAGRLIWTLDAIGHNHYSYLDGGIHAWRAAGLPEEQHQNPINASTCKITINPLVIAEREEILASLNQSDIAIWDARSAEEYRGEKVFSARGGHIPGAVNIDWLELIDRSNNMRLVDLQSLQQRLDSTGLTRNKTIITHCQTHHRSGLTYLAMKILGYPSIKGYHGSWSEWGNREDTPIEQ